VGSGPGQQSNGGPTPDRARRRLARTLARDRFRDYEGLLRAALSHEYRVVSLEDFLFDPAARMGERILILRHDVDQHPASALVAARIERRLELRSTWYVRWRTADPAVIEALRAAGGSVGFHYETLTRRVLDGGFDRRAGLDALLEDTRRELRTEIATFQELFGPLRSVCAHGDTRVPWASNLWLLEGEDVARYGVRDDANLGMRRYDLGAWLTDRSADDGAWSDGLDPLALLRQGVSPIQCLTHPNNWISGVALWRDRLLAASLQVPRPGARTRVTRTRSDRSPASAG